MCLKKERQLYLTHQKIEYMRDENTEEELSHEKTEKTVDNEREILSANEEWIQENKTGCIRTEGYYSYIRKKYIFLESNQRKTDKLDPGYSKGSHPSKLIPDSTVVTTRNKRLHSRSLFSQLFDHGDKSIYVENLKKALSLKLRTKNLGVIRSGIHSFGLFTFQNIPKGDFVIQYIGECVGLRVADIREKNYAEMANSNKNLANPSSYFFKCNDFSVIDATRKGNMARFINHSCNPNCTAKTVYFSRDTGVMSSKSEISSNYSTKCDEHSCIILIYAKKNILEGEEITYDYKFPIEDVNKIKCHCRSDNCRGFLN